LNVDRDETLRGSIYRALLRLGILLAVSEMVQVLYDLANVYWLGRVGKDAVAAPSASWPIISVFIAMIGGLLASGTALVSQYRGSGDEEGVRTTVGQVFFLGIAASSIIALTGFLTIEKIFMLIGIPEDVLPYATSYSKIFFISTIFIALWEGFRAVVSAAGNTILPMKLNVLGLTMNTVLDPFLILGVSPFPRLEVTGAAVSTVFPSTSFLGLRRRFITVSPCPLPTDSHGSRKLGVIAKYIMLRNL